MKHNQTFTALVLCGLLGFAQLGFAVVITTDGIGSSLTGDDFGHITNFTVGGIQHVSYVSYFLTVDGGAPTEVIGANFYDNNDNPVVYFEPGNFQDYTDEGNEYTNVIRTNDDKFVIGFGVRLRDASRSNSSMVSWEPTMQLTNISDDPITIEAMRYTQGLGSVTFLNNDTIAGSMDDAAYYWNGAGYVEPFGLTTSRQLDRNGALLAQIQAGGAGFVLNNIVNSRVSLGESAFIKEPFTIQPGGHIITNYTVNVTAVGNATLDPLDISIDFANVGNSADGNPGGLVIGSVLTGAPLGGVESVQAPLVRVSSIRRWSFATTIVDGSGATASLTFEYDVAADDIPDEDTLELATRDMLTDEWVKWDNVVRDAVNHSITAVGITENKLNSLWTFAFTEDIPVPDWPVVTEDSVYSSPVFGNLDNDDDELEIVVASWDRSIYALNPDGSAVDGWPILNVGAQPNSSPALGDIDNDEELEVVIGISNSVHAYNADGTELWSTGTNATVEATPAIGDLDGNGSLEVVVGDNLGRVFVFDGVDGTKWGDNWPFITSGANMSSPALGDLDGDGQLEIVVGSHDDGQTGRVYLLNSDGTEQWNRQTGGWVNSSPALGDIDNDGQLDIVVGSLDHNVYVWDAGGNALAGWPYATGAQVYSSPALCDLNDDGNLEVIIGSYDNNVYVLDHEANLVSSFPTTHFVQSSPAVGDIDGDGELEVVVGSWDNKVYAFNLDGTQVDGWPMVTGGLVISSPAIGDIDLDDNVEVVCGSHDGNIYCWEVAAPAGGMSLQIDDPDDMPWPMFLHDMNRSSKSGKELRPPIRPGDVSGDGNITAYDASLILQYCVGLITEFPVQRMSATQNAVPQDYEVSIPDLSAHAGRRVVVPVVIDKTAGLAAGGISIKYDETLLRANKTLSALNGAYWQANSDLVGEIRFAFAAFSQIQSSGELFTIEFEVLPCEEGTVVELELYDVQLAESKSIHLRNGSIELLPAHTRLLANYPNPFNPETWIPYQLAKNANVHISISNVNGKLIRTLNVGFRSAGTYIDKDRAVYYDGLDSSGERVSSGIYFYTIKAGDFSATRKMTILK